MRLFCCGSWKRARRGVAVVSLLTFIAFVPGALAFERDAAWNNTYSQGLALYQQYCAQCHGKNGEGGLGLPLNLQSFLTIASKDYIERSIRHGRLERGMPPLAALLKPKQISAIANFVKSWQFEPSKAVANGRVDGDPANGRALFNGICVGCHGLKGEGGPKTGGGHIVSSLSGFAGPALSIQGFLKSATDGYIKATLMYGRVGTPMGAYLKGTQGFVELSEQEINDIVAFIRSWER